MNQQTNGEIVTKGAVGVTASGGAWLIGHIHEINAFLQSGCLLLGLAISSISLFKLIRKKSHEKNSRRRD